MHSKPTPPSCGRKLGAMYTSANDTEVAAALVQAIKHCGLESFAAGDLFAELQWRRYDALARDYAKATEGRGELACA